MWERPARSRGEFRRSAEGSRGSRGRGRSSHRRRKSEPSRDRGGGDGEHRGHPHGVDGEQREDDPAAEWPDSGCRFVARGEHQPAGDRPRGKEHRDEEESAPQEHRREKAVLGGGRSRSRTTPMNQRNAMPAKGSRLMARITVSRRWPFVSHAPASFGSHQARRDARARMQR